MPSIIIFAPDNLIICTSQPVVAGYDSQHFMSLAYWVLVVASLQWLLQVVARITLVPHVVVASAAFLRRFVEDPLTTVDFLVQKQGPSLSSRRITLTRISERHERLVDQSDEARIGTKLDFIKARRWNGAKVYVV